MRCLCRCLAMHSNRISDSTSWLRVGPGIANVTTTAWKLLAYFEQSIGGRCIEKCVETR